MKRRCSYERNSAFNSKQRGQRQSLNADHHPPNNASRRPRPKAINQARRMGRHSRRAVTTERRCIPPSWTSGLNAVAAPYPLGQKNDKSLEHKKFTLGTPCTGNPVAAGGSPPAQRRAARRARCNDLTEELLTSKPRNLRESNRSIRTGDGTGGFTSGSGKTANARPIDHRSLQIGATKQKRAAPAGNKTYRKGSNRRTRGPAKAASPTLRFNPFYA